MDFTIELTTIMLKDIAQRFWDEGYTTEETNRQQFFQISPVFRTDTMFLETHSAVFEILCANTANMVNVMAGFKDLAQHFWDEGYTTEETNRHRFFQVSPGFRTDTLFLKTHPSVFGIIHATYMIEQQKDMVDVD